MSVSVLYSPIRRLPENVLLNIADRFCVDKPGNHVVAEIGNL